MNPSHLSKHLQKSKPMYNTTNSQSYNRNFSPLFLLETWAIRALRVPEQQRNVLQAIFSMGNFSKRNKSSIGIQNIAI